MRKHIKWPWRSGFFALLWPYCLQPFQIDRLFWFIVIVFIWFIHSFILSLGASWFEYFNGIWLFRLYVVTVWMYAVKHLERSIYYVRASVAIQMRIHIWNWTRRLFDYNQTENTKQSTTHDEIIMHLLWLVHIICILYYWNRCVTILYL